MKLHQLGKKLSIGALTIGLSVGGVTLATGCASTASQTKSEEAPAAEAAPAAEEAPAEAAPAAEEAPAPEAGGEAGGEGGEKSCGAGSCSG